MNDSKTLPPVAAITTCRVDDYDAWRPKFEGSIPVRKGAGVLGHDICLAAKDAHLVYVYFVASDAQRLDAFLGSPELPARLRTQGVTDPTYVLVEPIEDRSVRDGKARPAALISYEVADYARWKATFDAAGETRRRAGTVGHAVSRGIANRNRVWTFVQADAPGAIEAFLASEGWKTRLRDGGATTPPEIQMLHHTGISAIYA
jgi:hypothetical protein